MSFGWWMRLLENYQVVSVDGVMCATTFLQVSSNGYLETHEWSFEVALNNFQEGLSIYLESDFGGSRQYG